MSEERYNGLSELIQKDEAAHDYYLSLSYDEVQTAIGHMDSIHTLGDLKVLIAAFDKNHRSSVKYNKLI